MSRNVAGPPGPGSRVVTGPVSDNMARYAAWLTECTGYDVDPRSVAMAIACYEPWKASPEHLQAMAERSDRIAEAREADAARARERARASRAKPAARPPRSAAFAG